MNSPPRLLKTAIRIAAVTACSLPAVHAQSPLSDEIPNPVRIRLLTLSDFEYAGAFRLPEATFGASSLNYSEGPIAYDAATHSIFIVGHAWHQAIAQFSVPPLVESSDLAALNMAPPPLQPFVTVLDRATSGNPQNLDRIGGMFVASAHGGTQLIVNAYEYYDAPGDNTQTTLVVRDAYDLSGSVVDGFFTFDGGAGHTSGWMSTVPPEWRPWIGAEMITGQSSGMPIISRFSVGPSAFAFDPRAITAGTGTPGFVPTDRLLDYSLDKPLADDLFNSSLENDLWTHLSRCVYGFIAPDSSTYVCIGHSGGHEHGVCYKCIQNDGTLCGGYCAPDADDYAHYYWLFDVRDLIAVQTGQMAPESVRPYEYGIFPVPFSTRELGGGSYDPASGLLYLSVLKADTAQGPYSNPPVIVAYRIR